MFFNHRFLDFSWRSIVSGIGSLDVCAFNDSRHLFSPLNRFHFTLLNARHRQRRNIADRNTLIEIADNANLDTDQFEKDMSDRTLLSRLAEDHTFAVETLGVFGTPTLVFAERKVIFMKLDSPPPLEDCVLVFNEVRHLAEQRQYITEIKRP